LFAIMKVSSTPLAFLLFPLASSAFKLPFTLETIKTRFESIELPQFIKKYADPISTSPLLSLHKSLIDIPSISGNEREVGQWLSNYLISKNFTVETQSVSEDGERFNIFAYIGQNRTTHTLVTSHIDTVPPYIPHRVSSGSIYGRGSNDAKSSVAAQITAVEELIASSTIHEGDVSLLFVVGEETTGDGMKAANELGPTWKTVIFGEPTENKLAVGHKGIIMFDVIAEGRASHSGYPELGVNANSHLIRALYNLENAKLPSSDLLGESTMNVGKIEGGVAANVISPHAIASVLVRVAGDLDETLAVIQKSVRNLPVEIKFLGVTYGPQVLDYEVEGFQTIVCSYGTDVPNLHGEHKKYLYGPGSILTAHSDNEYVLKSDLFEAVAGYKKLIKESLWPTKRVPSIIEKTGLVEEEVVMPVEAVSSSASIKETEAAKPEGVEPKTSVDGEL
jgi:acetylornithine deacetylase